MDAFTSADKLAAVRREIEIRRRTYPGLVARGRLRPEKAERQIAVMEAIAADYAAIVAAEAPAALAA